MQFLMYSNSGSRYEQWIKPIIYVAMLYTSMSVSYHFIGVVAHEYLLALLIFYLVDKKQAILLVINYTLCKNAIHAICGWSLNNC